MSSAGWSNWDDVSLLTDRHILRTDNSAIARMSVGEAVANGTADNGHWEQNICLT